jgi:hypothetical protein
VHIAGNKFYSLEISFFFKFGVTLLVFRVYFPVFYFFNLLSLFLEIEYL